ncbi:MAG: helix-turn-helix domain-containing protein [Bdellovibrio sp.]
MRNAKLWFFHAHVVPDNAFRLYSYLRWVADKYPHPKGPEIVVINREQLKRLLGLSYNSIQRGLKSLIQLGLIELDPEKNKNKDCIRLTQEDEYNKVLLTQLFLSLLSRAKQETDVETSDLDVDE